MNAGLSYPSFDTAFQALTGYSPYRWQRRFFDRLYSSQGIPHLLDVPTGLGKTSIIPIWLIALAQQAQKGTVKLPRRLVYIVNRRTVVDRATSVVEQIRDRLLKPDDSHWLEYAGVLRAVAKALRGLISTGGSLLAVSTLRGELADNEEWKADPARAGIIIGTIDMIGSKLLFSGYGDGRYWRAQHAALIGQDSLIVHDEAHLTPAFSELLYRVAEVQNQAADPRPLHVMELSATSRNNATQALELEPEDKEDDAVRERLDAAKYLQIHNAKDTEIIKQLLVEFSVAHDNERAKVLIYVQSPDDARTITERLQKRLGSNTRQRVALLTGTLRGYERDQLVRNEVFQTFLDPALPVEQTVYLVSTSAGEVGVDLDADHLVCDLTTLDAMIQRLGRVNRRGGQGRVAQVDVVVATTRKDKPSDFERTVERTRAILERWASPDGRVDVRPQALRDFLNKLSDEERTAAFAPKPDVPPLTDILLDAWSLTSVTKQMPGRPAVAAYLHGLTNDPPETYVAWRTEVDLLRKFNADEEMLRDWFLACPIETRERLRDRTDQVKKMLAALLQEHRKGNDSCDFPVVLLDERGEAEWTLLSDITEKEFKLEYKTVVLPVEAGGLGADGALDEKSLKKVCDVAEKSAIGAKQRRRERWLAIKGGDGERYERLLDGESAIALPAGLREQERISLHQPEEDSEAEGEWRYLLVMVNKTEGARIKQTLRDHTQQVVGRTECIADALRLSPPLKAALVKAAEWHDRGKARVVWQRYACNSAPDPLNDPLAKSTKYQHPRMLGGYRHELGSLLEASINGAVRAVAEDERELLLHLIAAHHGWARPHFERRAWDHTRTTVDNEQATEEVLRRFGRLQQRFGRWGLAWLEALLRCADSAASEPQETGTEDAI